MARTCRPVSCSATASSPSDRSKCDLRASGDPDMTGAKGSTGAAATLDPRVRGGDSVGRRLHWGHGPKKLSTTTLRSPVLASVAVKVSGVDLPGATSGGAVT